MPSIWADIATPFPIWAVFISVHEWCWRKFLKILLWLKAECDVSCGRLYVRKMLKFPRYSYVRGKLYTLYESTSGDACDLLFIYFSKLCDLVQISIFYSYKCKSFCEWMDVWMFVSLSRKKLLMKLRTSVACNFDRL